MTLQLRHSNELDPRRRFAGGAAPAELDAEEGRHAVALAYERELATVVTALRRGSGVIVECDRILVGHVRTALRESSGIPDAQWLDVTCNKQPGPQESAMGHLLANTKSALDRALQVSGAVVVFEHLDLMALTLDGRPRAELNDLVYWLSEYSDVVKLAFWDPAFAVPEALKDIFRAHVCLQAVARENLWKLVSAQEGLRLSDPLGALSVATQARLHQQLLGSNPVEIRRVLRGLCQARSQATTPEDLAAAHDWVSEQTGAPVGVVAERPVGYEALAAYLDRHVVEPFLWRLGAGSAEELASLEGLMPRGLLVAGPPGVGKTAWMKWVAYRIGAPVFAVHGPELKRMHVGETEAAIRSLFQRARRVAPSMILIDEIDGLAPARGGASSTFDRAMVTQFLAEMGGLRQEEGVLVVGTTNRIGDLDEGFLRPGRFEWVEIDYPDDGDRRALLVHYGMRFGLGLTAAAVEHLVERTRAPIRLPGAEGPREARFSGDHLRQLCLHLRRDIEYERRVERNAGAHADDDGRLERALEAVSGGRRLPGETAPRGAPENRRER